MLPTLAHQSIRAVQSAHRFGHTCQDGKWYNAETGTKTPCPVWLHLETAADQVTRLHTRVHDAAHQARHVDYVAAAMTSTPLSDLPPEHAEAWRGLARQAIEGLSWSLDRTDDLTGAARAVQDRLRTTT